MEGFKMYVNQIFELSMTLNNEDFGNVFEEVYVEDYWGEESEEYVDQTFSEEGLLVVYYNKQYKKKVKLIVDPAIMTKGAFGNTDKFCCKLDKQIKEYFDNQYRMDDFTLSGMRLSLDINVESRENVKNYLKVLRRIGKVKGFSPSEYENLDEKQSFCLDGNSNAIDFLIYDLEQVVAEQMELSEINRKERNEMIEKTNGILRAEVHLKKPKAIRAYTNELVIADQMAELSKRSSAIFFDTFARVIPYGDFYKKDAATEILRKEVLDSTTRRKMLRLLVLIPEKKSLHLAQKELRSKDIEIVTKRFAEINLSPVTISKRHDKKYLKNLYDFIQF